MDKIDLNTGQFIFTAGEKSDKVFLLLEGEVGIFLPTNETQQPNHKIQENEIFVEMWKAAVTAGGLEQVAANLGISKASCAVKASNMRKAGYDLPQFRRGRPKKNQ